MVEPQLFFFLGYFKMRYGKTKTMTAQNFSVQKKPSLQSKIEPIFFF